MGHTPGPWYANQDCIEIDGPEGPRDVTLAVVLQQDNAAADAHLIAAAPELLGFLHQIADECKRKLRKGKDSAFCDRMILELCRAAISKAEGRRE